MTDQRIDDDLRQLLELAAEAEPVPDDGLEQLFAARDRLERPTGRPTRSRRGLSWPSIRKWVPATLIAVGILAGGAVAVGVHEDQRPQASSGTAGLGQERSAGDRASSGAAAAPSAVAPGRTSASEPAVPSVPPSVPRPAGMQPRIVQTGSIALTVDDRQTEAVLGRLTGVARGLGGYVAESSASSGGSSSASVTLRVPVAVFDQALSQASGLGRVTSSTTSAQDVTGQYVDLSARIKALQETRATYVRILGRAGTIDETLAVQQQITSVQTQIEQLQGQQQVLADRSDLATLTVSVAEPAASTSTTGTRSGFSGAWHRAVDGFAGGLQWLLAASGPVLLVVLIVAVLFWPVRRVVRVLRRQLI